ncbi:MAG: DUF6391 domain-containing protein [Dehalococcoidia bacterium]|nr:DUF6391 domain-containing protein [Dehalococcoidia bacterium]
MFPLNMVRRWLDDVRRNHALEHATVAVLFARKGPQRLAGRASGNGFFILGNVDPVLLQSCADEALIRLQRGESNLAVSPMCGTNLAVTGAVCATFTMASLARNRDKGARQRFGDAVSASTMGALAAQPLGRIVQEKITTRPDLDRTQITHIRHFLPWLAKVYTHRDA